MRQLALQASRYPDVDISFVIKQIKGRQIAKEKISTWHKYQQLLYPLHLSMEQASSEITAKYKESLCHGKSFVDLTGGFGVDFYFMSKNYESAVYVEQNADLAEIATHNFRILPHAAKIEIVNNDSVSFLQSMPNVDTIYIDPARRDSIGRKTVLISDCSPNLEDIDYLLNLKSKQTIIKLSPMLDISLALKSLSNVRSVHVLSVKNECKELVFVKDNEVVSDKGNVAFHCVDFSHERESIFTFSQEDKVEIKYTPTVCRYLYEPNSSIMKTGGYNYIQKEYDVLKLHPNSHLYTSDFLFDNFPGRVFEVDKCTSLSKKDVKENLSSFEQANLAVRNFPMSVQELRKKLKLKEGGDSYLFATTMLDEKKIVILTRKIIFG